PSTHPEPVEEQCRLANELVRQKEPPRSVIMLRGGSMQAEEGSASAPLGITEGQIPYLSFLVLHRAAVGLTRLDRNVLAGEELGQGRLHVVGLLLLVAARVVVDGACVAQDALLVDH